MKRIVVLMLCLCMVLPMVFVMALGAGATGAAEGGASVISTDKSVYAPGEAIKITASAGGEKDWVGIVPADAEGKPITNGGGLYWKYVNDLDDSSITTGKPMKEANAITLAERLGLASKDELFSVPTGKYFAFRVPNDMGLPAAVAADVVTYVPFTVSQFELEKTSFLYGEAINAKALYKNSTNGYIGLSHVKDDGTIGQNLYYTYITDANLNTTIDVGKGVLYGADKDKYGRLPAGRYLVYFVEDGNMGASSRDTRSEIYIDILGATVEKTEFKYGEPIMVKGYGAEKDWIGISQYDESTESGYWSNGSIRWRYIAHTNGNAATDGFGSGVAFDIREAKLTAAAAARGDLPVGEYVIFVGLDDCYAVDVSPYTESVK